MAEQPLMLSVSGLRGLVGRSLRPYEAARYGAAFGSWLKTNSDQSPPHVVVGRDSRPSGQMIEQAVVSGLAATGCRVTCLGIVTTPTTAVMVEHLGAAAGMVVTASHNPIEWNGLKALRHDGVAPPADQAQQIIDRFQQDDADWAAVEDIASIEHDQTAAQVHLDRILANVDAKAVRELRPKVVLDSVHGAGGPATASLLDALGVELTHLYAEPTGRFPHPPEPTAEHLASLGDAVRDAGADIGLAQDPDADRLAVVDEQGRYIGEEYTLALATMHVLDRQPGAVVTNLSTSRMIDDVASAADCPVHRSPVGEANVSSMMRQVNAVIGGEGNGGVIWPKVICVRDSLVGIGLILEMLATRRQRLSEIVASIPAYVIVKDKLPIQPGMAERVIDQVRRRFADHRLDEQDGIRIDFDDKWVHVRPSNTEPILRLVAEAPTHEAAHQLIDDLHHLIGSD